VRVLPEFVRGMFVADEDDNVYVMAYGPCSLNYKGVELLEKTFYPFRNQVAFEIKADKSFALNLKIPAWCKGYIISVNGEEIKASEKDNYVCLDRAWKAGDVIEISFKAEIEVHVIDDSDAASKYPLAVKYGALVFAYHVPEEWKAIPGNPMTPLPDGWSWWNVLPVYREADVPDEHERIGLRRYQFPWNIAIDENLSPSDIEIEEIEPSGYVWTNPMIKLHTHCYKAPFLCAPYQKKTLEPIGKYQTVTEKIPLELVPYGCTNLRITYFPRADLRR
ncbi:MAG: glycoside hydrolase family 127 protein, partial [Oscillospiraceae bacterium]|nr:glycoside hydrolase family 127 protein [Oscillospiraceae bacterium]